MHESGEMTMINRRNALKLAACGFGYTALAGLTTQAAGAYRNPLAPRLPHYAAKAKRVIFMFMQGGPSHLDTFDYKPELVRNGGKSGGGKARGRGRGKLLAPVFKFRPRGKSGLPISDLFPHLSSHADDLCLINGMHTNNPAHPQATIMMHTGSINFVRPSVGSWTVYGLGTENENLPGFITLNPLNRLGGTQNYGAAFLPAAYQGTPVSAGGRGSAKGGIPNLANKNLSVTQQKKHLRLIQEMNHELLERSGVDHDLEGIIESYELAFRMQTAVPHALDISKEPEEVREAYGVMTGATRNFGTQCLMARRLAEEGVRFIELTYNGWDQHNRLRDRLTSNGHGIDQPIAALMADLKQRGLFEDTLIVWGGEFGRTPQAQTPKGDGRRHNNRGFTMWMAGGGVKGGIRYGETDPTGGTSVKDKVHVHDLHATLLHLLGLNHEKLTYRHAGRDFRLTDVYGRVVKEIVA